MIVFGQAVRRISVEARGLDAKNAVLTIVAALPFVLGWVFAKTMSGLWVVVAWVWTAAVIGWRTAKGTDTSTHGG